MLRPHVLVAFLAMALPATAGFAQPLLDNGLTRVLCLGAPGQWTGLKISSGDRPVGVLHLGPQDALTARTVDTKTEGGDTALVFSGLSVAARATSRETERDDAVRFSATSFLSVTLRPRARWPTIAFDLTLEHLDVAAWQKLVGGTLPFHYLLLELPGATMFYQGGGLIPGPEVDPFPITAQGYMAGKWAAGWTYAPAMAAWAVPAVGLWNHRAKAFVAYDFDVARHTDRSDRLIASAGWMGEGGPPFFCLVHPYQRNWVDLTYPGVPSRVSSRFELLYTFDLPDRSDPNQFVLERLWEEHRALLTPVSRMSDLAWIREQDGYAPGGGIEPTHTGPGLIWPVPSTGFASVFVEPDSRMLGNDFICDGVRRALLMDRPEALEGLRRDLEELRGRCTWTEIEGERCATWVHPLDGKFRDRWGGEACAGVHHPSTFQIGAAMLMLYEAEHDPRLLPFIDGVYNWSRHYLFTRNGVCDLPWAMFSREATAAGENFLLTYRRVFRDDPERRGNRAEALALARTALYKNLWFYTADPDLGDELDPTFLNQATNDCRWAGRVTWNEAGWVVRSMVPIYCDTGDAFLKYLLRGCLERYYAGYREDGGMAENLQIFGEIEPPGLRTAGFPDAQHGGAVRRWARPMAPARLRVVVGEKVALAFGLGTRAYDIADYRYAPEGGLAFRLIRLPPTSPAEPVDLVVTAPFRDLRGLPIRLNGQPLPADRHEYNWTTAGEDVYLRGIAPGDVVEIGDASAGVPMAEEQIPYRSEVGSLRDVGPWGPVALAGACNVALNRAWWEADSYCGLVAGRRWVWGMPLDLVDPDAAGGRDAVSEATVAIQRRCRYLFAAVGALRDRAPGPVARLRVVAEGREDQVTDVFDTVPVDLCNGFPLRRFDTYLVALDLGGAAMVRAVRVESGTLLALTLAPEASDEARRVLARAEAARGRALAREAAQCYQAPRATCPDRRPWADGLSQPWRFRLTVLPSEHPRSNALVRVAEDFGALLGQVGLKGAVRPGSLQAVEVVPGAASVPVPVQFDSLSPETPERGELLLRMPGETAPGAARSFEVYFGPDAVAAAQAAMARLSDEAATVTTGPGGLRFEFSLDGSGPHPRWGFLAFDRDGDSDSAGEANVLGASGWNGGGAELTTCTDYVTWYDNGGLQSTAARAEVVHAGPLSATLRVSGLQLWGKGDRVPLANLSSGPWGASPRGHAEWFFRFYASSPVVEQWVRYTLEDLDNGWTRPLQVRYGLRSWEQGATRVLEGSTLASADDLVVLPLPGPEATIPPECGFTPDGHVLQVLLNEPDVTGDYYSGRWAALPSRLPDREYASLLRGAAVEQFAVEAREGGQVTAKAPRPLEPSPFDPTLGHGPGPRPAVREVPASPGILNPDPSFEQREAFWLVAHGESGSRWTSGQVWSGRTAADLTNDGHRVALVTTTPRANLALGLRPNSAYEVSFWAKCVAGEGDVQVNFYHGAGYDFKHEHVSVPADGEWHQLRATVTTGDFPPLGPGANVFTRGRGIAPSLRLWTINQAQKTFVDQVEVRAR